MESNVNRQLDEAKIKAMTGGEPITARHLYKNFAEFKPRFKLWLVRQRSPARAGDRRRHLAANSGHPDERPARAGRNRSRPAAQAQGGMAGHSVLLHRSRFAETLLLPLQAAPDGPASAGWREAVDHVRRFVMEMLVIGCSLDNVIPAGELHGAFEQWCARHGEQSMSTVALKAKLVETFDLTHARTKHGSEWRGVRWKS